ncbi:MAG TPA: hypothetical protein VFC78_21570 [Tepidisphaeraceae bacterium]|nr:hypothetical protein [Tepidisphaeraceae bacterium]
MPANTFLQGLSRVLNCPKVHVAVSGLITTWFAVRYAADGLPPTQRASLWVAFIGAVTVQLREIINAWTEEDVAFAANRSSQRSPVAHTTPLSGSSEPSPVQSQLPWLSTAPVVSTFSTPIVSTRSPLMPARTKLPLILIAFALITLLAASGCQTCPELAIYRDGLHQVDEPLYEAHLLLLDDAVKANLRTDADRQVVQQGIGAARGLYEQGNNAGAPSKP